MSDRYQLHNLVGGAAVALACINHHGAALRLRPARAGQAHIEEFIFRNRYLHANLSAEISR